MKTDRKFVDIMGVPSSINSIINEAISISYDYKCRGLNGVMLLLGAFNTIEDCNKILEKCGLTYNLVFSSFEYMVGNNTYERGEMDKESIMNNYVFNIINTALINSGKKSAVTSFLRALNDIKDSYLIDFLDYIELDLDLFIELCDKQDYIPDELKSFVKDANKEVELKNEEISNVDCYVDEMINILARKNKKNPCLVGEAGVGKTTIVEALIKRINSGDVPDFLKDKHVLYINNSAMIGGTRFRGDFEERLALLFDYASKNNTILFLDEIHTFMTLGKNGDESQSVGNSIKEYLNDGRISIIGTTTNKEWHKFIESDSALKRRLQEVYINEPTVSLAIDMLNKSKSNFEDYHNVKITQEAIDKAVKLSDRYMKLEKLPDKAFKIIDQASATVKIVDSSATKLVTEKDVIHVVSKLTGINVDKLSKSELSKLKNLESIITESLVGQDEAVTRVAKAIRRGKAGVRDNNRPIASLLFVGPTGVGKTELCKLISKEVYNNKESFIKIDMSEFNEEYSISKLIGSAPGYVGYGEGGMLTEKVKKHPYSLILLDEIEKANPKVFDSFLQVLDEGRLTDAQGQTVDFTNCIVVMTSNAGYGADQFGKQSLGFSVNDNKVSTYDEKERIAMKALESSFKPEFLNRIDNIIIFNGLTKEISQDIVKIGLNKLKIRLKEQDIDIDFDESIIKYIAEQGYSEKYGARNINRAIQTIVEDRLTDEIIGETITQGNKYLVRYNEIVEIVER